MIKSTFFTTRILGPYFSLVLILCTCLLVSLSRAEEVVEVAEVVNSTSSIVAPPAFIETEMIPKNGVVGQKRILQVRLYTKSWLRKAPRYPDLLVDGAVVLTPGAFGVNSTAERDGGQYTVQTKEYQLFPRRPGAFIVSPFSLSFSIAGQDGVSLINTELKSESIGFKVTPLVANSIALDDKNVSGFSTFNLVGRELQLEQRWGLLTNDKPLRAGDAYEREIKLSLNDSLAMFIPPFNQIMPEVSSLKPSSSYNIVGGTAFQALEKVDDISNRGDSTAVRIERWHYVFDRPGRYKLPDVTLYWWDLNSAQWNIEISEGREINVLPSLLSEGGATGSNDRLSTVVLSIIFIAILALLFLVVFNKTVLIAVLKAVYKVGRSFFKSCLRRAGFPLGQLVFWRLERERWYALEESLKDRNNDQLTALLYHWLDAWRALPLAKNYRNDVARIHKFSAFEKLYLDDGSKISKKLDAILGKLYQESGGISSEDFDELALVCQSYRNQLRRMRRVNKYRPEGAIKNFNRDSICSRSLNP